MNLTATINKASNKRENYFTYEKYGIENGNYGIFERKKDSNTFIPKGSAIYVDKIINRIDTGEKFLMLHFYDSQGCKVKTTFPRKDLTETGIMALLGFGAQILKQDARALITSIMNQEPNAPYRLEHKKLGFSIYDGKTVFLAKNAIGADSKYDGKLKIGKTGKYKKWNEMIKEEVIGNIPLEFMLAVAGSGIFTDYLRDKVQVENVIVNLVGESSTGKSTAGLLLVSCGAKPTFQGNSLALNFSDTQNAILASIPSSYPVLIDEGSLCRYNPTSFLYNISSGKEKERLTKNLDKADASYFSTAIVTTSEKSLLSMADENSGLLVRVLEIENVVWTKSAESSDKIKNIISSNHGWLIPKLAEKILSVEREQGQEEIISRYYHFHKLLVENSKQQGHYNNLTERACKQYALILLSASFIEDVIGIRLHIDELINFIETHSPIKEENRVDIGQRALSYLMQYISEHYSQFCIEGDSADFVPKDCAGRITKVSPSTLIDGTPYSKRLYITNIKLTSILHAGQFPDIKVILKRWKEEGILKSEKDRYISDIQIVKDMPKVKGYMINMPEQEGHQ